MKFGRAARNEQRIIRLERNEDGAVAALGHQVQAVIEELPEERQPGVERHSQPEVRLHVRDEIDRLVVGRAEGAVQAGAGNDFRAGIGCGRGDGRRIVRRLIDDQVADRARLRIEHQVARRRGVAYRDRRQTLVSAVRNTGVSIRGKMLSAAPNSALSKDEIVVGAVERAQPEGHLHVREEVEQILAIGVALCDPNLVEDEFEIPLVELSHASSPSESVDRSRAQGVHSPDRAPR